MPVFIAIVYVPGLFSPLTVSATVRPAKVWISFSATEMARWGLDWHSFGDIIANMKCVHCLNTARKKKKSTDLHTVWKTLVFWLWNLTWSLCNVWSIKYTVLHIFLFWKCSPFNLMHIPVRLVATARAPKIIFPLYFSSRKAYMWPCKEDVHNKLDSFHLLKWAVSTRDLLQMQRY